MKSLQQSISRNAVVPLRDASDICAAADDYASVHKFANFANWIVPGHVMLGRYPFMEPSRCTTREIGVQQLEQILAAGTTTFVSLQVRPGCS
jgi:hypothetical protein